MRIPRHFPPLLALPFVLSAACDRDPPAPPAPARPGGPVEPARAVLAAPPEAGGAPSPARSGAPSAAPAAAPSGGSAAGPEPVGGPWVTCYGRFRPTSTPKRDVLRLGLLCGPENGMKLVGDVLEGDATALGAEHAFDAKAGECFRVLAVADKAVTDLGVEVRDPKGNAIAGDHNNDRWPVVNPDGPLCVMDDGRFTIRVKARKGAGKYALELWKLP